LFDSKFVTEVNSYQAAFTFNQFLQEIFKHPG
jgi:hypothetical protein